ncbi:MAG: SdiA-regulated domain-containing protein [Ekhidna sp.]|nr:SdiA-regulated domain-containing protein [Ekhidna sp.]
MKFIKNISVILLFSLAISFHQSCESRAFGQHADSLFLVTDNLEIKYDLKKPTQKYFMPYVLEEISGLTFLPPNSVLAVDDESGKIFQYDFSEKNIIHSIAFNKSGDYEGVELVEDTVYVLKSEGDVFRFPFGQEKKTLAIKEENLLSAKNDTEGLGFNPKTKQLIIACKEKGGIGEAKLKGRAFYTMDISSLEIGENPDFVIGPNELIGFWSSNRPYQYEKERVKFKPSAIAVHPTSGHYYILSSVGKLLIVTSSKGEILATYPISPRVLGQPEGICFSPKGDLYISSEGEGDRGYVLKFEKKRS